MLNKNAANAMSIPNRVAIMAASILCAFAMLTGCAQQPPQPQGTEAEQQVEQSQSQGQNQSQSQEDSTSADVEQEQASALAEKRLEEAVKLEPAITKDLQSIEDDEAKLVGLDFRLKSQESLTRKIILDSHDKGIPLEEAAAEINDVIRYTICIEPSLYVSKATEFLKALEAKGYTVVKFKNLWGGDTYKGLNTQIEAPSGTVFELQVHTPDSFEMISKTHPYYEIARDENSTEEEVEEATRAMIELVEGLEVPEGALEFAWE